MRIKCLSFAASFLVLLLAVTSTSCLNSDNNYELSSDNIITEFEIDTIYGVKYKFTIDQGGGHNEIGKIFNVDSVPFSADTIINKILITQIESYGYPTAGKEALEDTLFVMSDSVDLSNTMKEPLVLRMRSWDGEYIKTYHISVRIHQTDPDSLVWGGGNQLPYSSSFSSGVVKKDQETKSVMLGDKVLVFTFNGTNVVFYSQPDQPTNNWTPTTVTDLPSDTRISSILNYNNRLFAVDEPGNIYHSTNGISWSVIRSTISKASLLRDSRPQIKQLDPETKFPAYTLITTFGQEDKANGGTVDYSISGIVQLKEETGDYLYYFASAAVDIENNRMAWTIGDPLPGLEKNTSPEESTFPVNNLRATKSFKTTTGLQRVIAVGNSNEEEPTETLPWFSLDGLEWAPIEPTTDYELPPMNNPSILYYNSRYYAFGDDFSAFYTSVEGRMWEKTEKKFLFPSDKESGEGIFEGREKSYYSMVVDNDNFIWLIWGNNGTTHSDEVWKGRLNRLGFIIQ